MSERREKILMWLLRCYLRTFPPISKNGNGIIGNFKRVILAVPITITVKGDFEKVSEVIKKYECG